MTSSFCARDRVEFILIRDESEMPDPGMLGDGEHRRSDQDQVERPARSAPCIR